MQIQEIRLAVDAVVFGYQEDSLHVLLVKQKFGELKNTWVLPGGFVLNQEGITEAVERELQEEAGIKVNYLEQLYTFGDDVDRDPRFRVVSVAYFALVKPDNYLLVKQNNSDASDAHWFDIKKLPHLGYDHAKIVLLAQQRLKNKLSYQPVGFDLIPALFPFSALESLYTGILDTEIDRRNFRKKIMSLGFVEETKHIHQEGSGRPAKLFRFNPDKYKELEQKGFYLGL